MTVFYPQQTPPSLVFAYADGMFAINIEYTAASGEAAAACCCGL